MAYQINGSVIITDSRELVGVNTAGFSGDVYVGSDITVDSSTGTISALEYTGSGANLSGVVTSVTDLAGTDLDVATVSAGGTVSVGGSFTVAGDTYFGTGIRFSSNPSVIISDFSDNDSLGNSDSTIPTQAAVKAYVDNSIGGNVNIDVETDSGNYTLNIASTPLRIVGTTNEIETTGVSVGSTEIQIGLPDNVTIDTLTVGGDLTATVGEASFGNVNIGIGSTLSTQSLSLSGTTVDSIGLSSALGTSDTTLPSQKAVKEYVDAQVGGNANLTINDGASGITTIALASEQLTFSAAANETTITIQNNEVVVGVNSDLVLGQSLTVNATSLVVDDTQLTTDVPVTVSNTLNVTQTATFDADVVVGTGASLSTEELVLNNYAVTGISTNQQLGTSDVVLPTQNAVKVYVDNQIGGSSSLNFIGDGNSGIGTGEIELASETLVIQGAANQITASSNSLGGNTLNLALTNDVSITNSVSAGTTVSAADGVFSDQLEAQTLLYASGAGIGLSVTNNALIGADLQVSDIVPKGTETDVRITATSGVVDIDTGTLNVLTGGLTVASQIEARGAGIGLTVSNNAYIVGDLDVEGQLNAANILIDNVITSGVQAEGPGPLIIDGEDPATNQVGIALTNGPVTIQGITTVFSDLTVANSSNLLVEGSVTAGGQLLADLSTGIGLTVKADAYLGGDVEVVGRLNLNEAAASGLQFGAGAAVTSIQTTLNNATNAQLPTALAVKNYVDSGTAGAALSFTDGTTQSDINIAAEVLEFLGADNEIDVLVGSATTTAIEFSLPTTLIAPGSVEATGSLIANGAGIGLSVVNQAQFDGNVDFNENATFDKDANFQGGLRVTAGVATVTSLKLGLDPQAVTGINTDAALVSATNDELISALAVKTYVDNSAGSISSVTLADAGNVNGSYYITFGSTSTGASDILTDADQLTYNPSTGILEAQEFNALSDIRYKENIEVIVDPLAKVGLLRGVTFDWKDAPGRSAGLIAQELLEVMPDLVTESPDKLTVNYNGVIGLLVEAVKELTARVEELESRN